MTPSSKASVIKGVIALSLLIGVIAWMAGAFNEQIDPGLNPVTASDQAVVATVTRQRITPMEPVSATVQARQTTLLSSRLLARVEKIHARAGDMVKAGELLVELDQRDLQARVAQAKEQMSAQQAEQQRAEKEYQRIKTLRQEGMASIADLDRAVAARDSANAQLARSQQALNEAITALSYARLAAPMSARVVDRFVEPGDTVSPGMKILSLYDPLAMRIDAAVRESLALTLAVGDTLEAEIDALDTQVTVTVEEIVPAADPGARSLLIKMSLPYQAQLLPGLYAKVLIPQPQRDALTIPQHLIVESGQLNLVWVKGEQGVERRLVRLGQPIGDRVEVVAGLAEGEQLVTPMRYQSAN